MPGKAIDPFDRGLLEVIQERIPLVREPFAQIATQLGCSEELLLDRLAALSGDGGIIREISGIFDPSALGYTQGLVAFRVDEEALDVAGAIAAGHPGVSHCYGRTGTYNLWFTLAVSQRSQLGLERTVHILAHQSKAAAHMILPTLKRYKLDVRFAAGAATCSTTSPRPGPPADGRRRSAEANPPLLSDEQTRAVRALQSDLPRRKDPFSAAAHPFALQADMLLVHATDFLAAGYMRRYAAVLHHRPAGARSNVLAVWRVTDAAADAAGAACARVPAVSHCYLRPTAEDWPYNLYTMIHGRTAEDCGLTVDEVATTTGLLERVELWTATEYKKQRVQLFSDDEAAWEAR